MKDDRVKEMWSVVADAPLQSVLDSPECPPLLRQTLTGVLSWQTRNETPVRRALTSPRIAPQWVAALLALGATVTVEADESIVAAVAVVEMDAPSTGSPPRVLAVAGQGGLVRQARVALTGVWPQTVHLAAAPAQLVGGPLDESSIRAVAEAVEKEVAPKGDFLGSEEYRRAVAGVLTRRAMESCLHQEAGDE